MLVVIRIKSLLLIGLLCLFSTGQLTAQQVSIQRVEEMPNMPQPYLMADWKQIAFGYDSLAFDLDAGGEYLPLVKLYSNTTNYPEHGSFYQQTYVGQSLGHNEAINSLMALVGASLCGIDKSNQEGNNWVLMAEEFFNWKNGQDVYLNNVGGKSGNDFWYESMPNVLFYQLYSLYPGTGHFSEQFLTVADRWLEAVFVMGGSTAPWAKPYMNYRAFNLETMLPRPDGVPEPGASGALAWIFYQAYNQSGMEKYRIAAELCMEFFSELDENPVYEVQYLYGAIMAARMNGELGTRYDLEKIMNWCFDTGPLRVWAHTEGWGITVGSWNGLDFSGINGAISKPGNTTFGDYAFLMNSFQQAGILPPVVRYDDRYARAIGKYLLNMSNSARLFYSKYLPSENQDGSAWSQMNDPNSYIAYEAVRQYKDGLSPFATGDALQGGWAPTNLSLYSSSAVGYLASILETTNVEGILKFDLLKTDFFHDEAYPSYLIYNPHATARQIDIDAGADLVDLYDAVSNQVIYSSVSGNTQLMINPDEALVVVLIPSGSALSREGNKMLCQGLVIDYILPTPVSLPLRLKALAARDTLITVADEGTSIYCTADNSDPGEISYVWMEKGVEIGSGKDSLVWTSPKTPGSYYIKCTLSNQSGDIISDSVKIEVLDFINTLPEIEKISLDPSRVDLGDTARLSCSARDPDGGEVAYLWSAVSGSFTESNRASTTWNAPDNQGEYKIYCEVSDKHGGSALDSIIVRVSDLSGYERGSLIAHYPFNYNVNDYSGNDNHGIKQNVSFINIRDGAYDFNGFNSVVEVPSNDDLNCNEAITICFWMKATQLFERETYPVSHGLWHRRWKVSVSNGKVRWTIRTNDKGSTVITDLDSSTPVEKDRLFQVTATYDGLYSDLYIDSEFEGFLNQSGLIEDADVALTIGQAEPDVGGYNFKGVLDEFRIYDYALSHEDIKEAYQEDLLVSREEGISLPHEFSVSPNPFHERTYISYQLFNETNVWIEILDIRGKTVRILFGGRQGAGRFRIAWDGKDGSGEYVAKGLYLCTIKLDNALFTQKIVYN